MRIWKASKFQRGLYGVCLRTALENHRLRVKDEIQMMIESKEKAENKEADRRQAALREQLTLSWCDQNGWMG
jgi:hypothetical protein